MVPLWARVDLGMTLLKGYSTFPKDPALLEPHHQIGYVHILDTRWARGLTPLQRCSQCILQLQPTGQCSIMGFDGMGLINKENAVLTFSIGLLGKKYINMVGNVFTCQSRKLLL